MLQHPFDVSSARRAAEQGQLQVWLEAYLPTVNPPLLEGLRRAPRWWVGPLSVALDELDRSCGPEEGMEFSMTPEAWERRLGVMDAGYSSVEAFPPLIATLRQGRLSLRDGNTRHALFKRRSLSAAWVLVWYNRMNDALDGGHSPDSIYVLWSDAAKSP